MSCAHRNKEVRRKNHSAGYHLVEQCLDCGVAVSNPLPHSAVKGIPIPDFDFSAAESAKYVDLEQRQYELAEERKAELREWRRDSQTYYSSEEWRERRRRVLRRDEGICQGCLVNEATQVHHARYTDFGSEFMFDLISLCDDCHDKLTDKLGHGRPA